MLQGEIKSRVCQVFDEAFNRGNFSAPDDIFAPDVIDYSVAREAEQIGLDGFKQRIAGHRTGFPDLQFTIHQLLADNDLAAFRWTMQGTQQGPWSGRPVTSKQMTITRMNIEHLEEGKIIEHWSNPNILSAFQQLGFLNAS